MAQIGRNIKKIRNVKGLSQQSFAELFQLTRGNISSYEEFRAEPKIDVIVKIANYFSIPLNDFIAKDLSVNELLHYNSELVLETEKIKLQQQIIKVPYVPALYISDYVENYKDDDFLCKMPALAIPCNTKFKLIAFEVDNQDTLPANQNYHNGDILVFEEVVKENIHRINGRLGMIVDGKEIKSGIYHNNNGRMALSLNEYVEYAFDLNSENQYWVLRMSVIQSS